MSSTEIIWYKDLAMFIGPNNFNIFFPNAYMSFEEKLNSLYRLVIYTMLLTYLFTFNLRMCVSIIIICGLLSIFIYEIYVSNKMKTDFNVEKVFEKPTEEFTDELNDDRKCIRSTEHNPMSNVLVPYPSDIKPDEFPQDDSELAAYYNACSVSDPQNKEEIEQNLEKSLYKDVEDIFGRKHSARQWYTVPSLLLNDQTKLANWLYKDGLSTTNKTVEF